VPFDHRHRRAHHLRQFEHGHAGVTVKAGDVGEALEVAADLLEAAGAIAPDTTGATACAAPTSAQETAAKN
jgi:hypothetical protein